MLWLSRPPFLRWFAAGAILLAALAWDLSNRRTAPIPYALAPIVKGTPITDELIEWRDVSAGTVVVPDLGGAMAAVDISPGDPITSSVVTNGPVVPDDWWTVPLAIPPGVGTGDTVRVVLPDGSTVDGIVTQPPSSDTFGVVSPAAAGFPADAARAVAIASEFGELAVLVEP